MAEQQPTNPLCYNTESAPCAVCGAEGRPCETCRLDFYCGDEHRALDEARHAAGCGALEERRDDALGRHLVFAKDVPAGTVVLRELPMLVVPPPWNPRMVFCVGCLSDGLSLLHSQCPRCGWPVCGAACSRLPRHQLECAAFQRAGFKCEHVLSWTDKPMMWTALAALRTHLALEKQPLLLDLQSSHSAVLPSAGALPGVLGMVDAAGWRCTVGADVRQGQRWPAAARWLREKAGLHWIAEQDLVRAAGICDINGVQLNPMDAVESVVQAKMATFVFHGVSFVEHCCNPTAMLLCRDSEAAHCEQLLVTTRDVKAGEHLSLDYLDAPFQDAVTRRRLLRRGWSFECRCERCVDPTACGVHLGSPCCPVCSERGEQQLMAAELAGWDGQDGGKPGYRCLGCGQSDDVPDMDDVEADLVALKTAMSGYDTIAPTLDELTYPDGPLHKDHRLRLLSELSASLVVAVQLLSGHMSDADIKRNVARVERMLAALGKVKQGLSHHRWALLIVKYDLLFHSLETGGPRGPHRLQVMKERCKELEATVPLLEPFYFSPTEKQRLFQTYQRPASLFSDALSAV
ncbi:uncharacterized protein LOC117646163 [Thrips palmi]|uniref:Uncharacterized protein LOC117646163 n=1 Tax=Thrips palmi TaxID=161013 RepID=A0A6P8YYS4_THRPL|nr:uncharacterized protein LOC117646163 [Thrips palmi]XP_034242835.1 uncharacterized protein LOC117646163 [Thrips palmi]XP_034242845.1 uncharacterized protein LOC117646163 [Thrips palmi]XP_034242855.1 uncharacterized protein LOC117646163 [Thrips palmi]XP_034242864.1 uncharacterized protein LOC117646163 [Thrips palmi]XP_034242874.1 uncharacterized protein LOC117646163 [Thrips palmi]XP_034242882.1 uncharacterized protein LOC117646163 [Thrips palmi]XP_034242889.1 uncharacterized protein LOC1176